MKTGQFNCTEKDGLRSMQVMSFGPGGMQDISVSRDDKKNNLQRGTVLRLNGYSCPEYVIVENQGIDPKYANHGARYLCVNRADFCFKTEQAYLFDHISTKKDNRILLYYTDEVVSIVEVEQLHEKAIEKQKTDQEAARVAAETAETKEAKGRELFAKYIPADAVALIVAELATDECDSMTDYFHASHSKLTILGWSKHKRDIFSEMRKHAHKIPETEHLSTKPETEKSCHPKDEHREKYSMGAGYYLKAAGPWSNGWRISKRTKYGRGWDAEIYRSLADRCVFEAKIGQIEQTPSEPSESSDLQTPPIQPARAEIQPEAEPEPAISLKTPVAIGEYKGHPTLSLPNGGRDFTFGLSKAKTILNYLDEIRDFVDKN